MCYVPLSAVPLRTMTKHRSPIAWQQRYVSKFRKEHTKSGASGLHFSRCSWEILGGMGDCSPIPTSRLLPCLKPRLQQCLSQSLLVLSQIGQTLLLNELQRNLRNVCQSDCFAKRSYLYMQGLNLENTSFQRHVSLTQILKSNMMPFLSPQVDGLTFFASFSAS